MENIQYACSLGLALLLGACSGGGNNPPPPPVQPPISGWTQFFGSGFTPPSFDFPAAPGSAHYVVQPGKAQQLGQTLMAIFTISGSGSWGISDPSDTLPPTMHLFLWENGDNLSGAGAYETYREWCGRTEISNPGQYIVSCKLDPALWTGVFGQTPSAGAFQHLLNNIYGVGFTFGGASFSGHGVYSASGTMHFQLDAFSIQ